MLENFFSNLKVDLPKINKKKVYYPDFLKNLFKDYEIELDNLLNNSNSKTDRYLSRILSYLNTHRNIVTDLSKHLVKAVTEYFNGHPSKAYDEFSVGMQPVFNNSILLNFINEIPPEYQTDFYRMRVFSTRKLDYKEMFHVPFEKRKSIDTQRYSIPGFPCLYLGSSAYVCWHEMKKPDINKLQVSKLKTENIRILHFGLPPISIVNTIKKLKNSNILSLSYAESYIKGFIILWPLIAACSIKVNNSKNKFKEEYIIPQLLLQWVRDKDKVEGIRYFSVEMINNYPQNSLFYQNYVFPVKNSLDSGLCTMLKSNFEITEPISYKFDRNVFNSLQQYTVSQIQQILGQVVVNYPKNNSQPYNNTDLHKIEIILSNRNFNQIV